MPRRVVRRCLERDVIVADGDGESPLGQLERAVRVTRDPGDRSRAGPGPAPVGARRPAPRRGPRPRGHARCSSPARPPTTRAPLASRWRSMACSVRSRLSGRCRSASSACSKPADRLPVGRARHRLRAGLAEIGDGLLPHLAPERVVGQALDVLGEPVGVEALDGLDDPGVERAPALLEQAAVGHLVGERVLEGVLEVGEEARLVEELGGLEVGEAVGAARPSGSSAIACEQGDGHVLADDRGGLEEALVLRRQPVDARRQDRLHRRRDLDGVRRLRQPVGAALARRAPRSRRGVRTLSSRKNGLPSVRAIRSRLSGSRPASAPSSVAEQRLGALRRRAGRAGAGV